MPNSNWDNLKLMFCLDRPKDYVNHLKQELTEDQMRNKRDWKESKKKEEAFAKRLEQEDDSAAT